MIKLSKLMLIPLYFLFLPAFCIPGGALSTFIPVYNIFLYVCIGVIGVFFLNKYITRLFLCYKHTSYKYLIFFIVYCILSDLILLIFQVISLPNFIYSILVIIIGYYFFYSIYPVIIVNNNFSEKEVFKFIIASIWVILIWGIIEFIGELYNITPIIFLESIISNKLSLITGTPSSILLRIKSVFTEPGFYAYFLNINLIFIYNISKTKYQIFKNKILNKLLKTTIIPLTLINILLTFSPINIIFMLVIIFIYLVKAYKQKVLVILPIIFVIAFQILQLDIVQESRPYKRIQSTIVSFTNLEKFANDEASLYTRICSYVNLMYIWKQYPILGVGSGLSKNYTMEQFKNLPIPLSREIIFKMNNSYKGCNLAILYSTLAENGIIGFILLYAYFIKTILSLCKIKQYFTGFEYVLINSLIPTLIITVILTCYESFLINSPYTFLVFILANSFHLKYWLKQNTKNSLLATINERV